MCLLNCWTCVQRLMERVKPAEDIVLACVPWQVRKGRASLHTALSGSTCQDLRKKGPHNTYHTPTELRNEKPEKKKPEALPPPALSKEELCPAFTVVFAFLFCIFHNFIQFPPVCFILLLMLLPIAFNFPVCIIRPSFFFIFTTCIVAVPNCTLLLLLCLKIWLGLCYF